MSVPPLDSGEITLFAPACFNLLTLSFLLALETIHALQGVMGRPLKVDWVAPRRHLLRQVMEANSELHQDNIRPVSRFEKTPPEADLVVLDDDGAVALTHTGTALGHGLGDIEVVVLLGNTRGHRNLRNMYFGCLYGAANHFNTSLYHRFVNKSSILGEKFSFTANLGLSVGFSACCRGDHWSPEYAEIVGM